ncbi:hypothetical protein M1513_01125 [Patescibacteria group bacterium]|nr:hypothetical protein [Patescibacteria group bacterium]MCL5733717.1 hypothetical protein [Patescibacteria group bacterium]
MSLTSDYLETLKERQKKSRIYKDYQLIGLEIAQILEDQKHKALYIKLAKENNKSKIFDLAKEIAQKKGIKNKGAYFMKIIYRGRKKKRKNNKKTTKEK